MTLFTGLQTVIRFDSRQILPLLPKASFSLVATDPPYAREALPLYELLLAESGRLLAPGGSLVVIAPHYAMPELFAMPAPGLKFRWVCAMTQRDGSWARLANAKHNLAVTWKPILWWTRDPWDACDYSQVVDSFVNAPPEKTRHEWEQSETWAEWVLDSFARDAETANVLDPFAGSGTLNAICQRRGIRGTAVEKDPKTFEVCYERIHAETEAQAVPA